MNEYELQSYADNLLADRIKNIYPKGDILPDLRLVLETTYEHIYDRGIGLGETTRTRIANAAKAALERAYQEAYK